MKVLVVSATSAVCLAAANAAGGAPLAMSAVDATAPATFPRC